MAIVAGFAIIGLVAIIALSVAGSEGVSGDTSCLYTALGLGALVILLAVVAMVVR